MPARLPVSAASTAYLAVRALQRRPTRSSNDTAVAKSPARLRSAARRSRWLRQARSTSDAAPAWRGCAAFSPPSTKRRPAVAVAVSSCPDAAQRPGHRTAAKARRPAFRGGSAGGRPRASGRCSLREPTVTESRPGPLGTDFRPQLLGIGELRNHRVGRDGRRLGDLAEQNAFDLIGEFRVMVAFSAGFADRLQQRLVIVVADAERRGPPMAPRRAPRWRTEPPPLQARSRSKVAVRLRSKG